MKRWGHMVVCPKWPLTREQHVDTSESIRRGRLGKFVNLHRGQPHASRKREGPALPRHTTHILLVVRARVLWGSSIPEGQRVVLP